MITTDHLRRLGTLYSERQGLKLSTIGVYALNHGGFFERLSKGHGCTLATAQKLVAWFSKNWPDDLPWPADIPRPPKAKREAA